MASSKPTQRIVMQGKQVVTSTNKKSVRTVLENKDESDESQGESSDKINKRTKVIRPNAFLSFRITSPDIIHHANILQKEIIESNPLLSKASVAIPTLHVTLLVFALKTEQDREKARQSLADIYEQIALAKLSPPQISFTGLSHFNNKVLYIDPVKDTHLDQLTRIAEICREIYEKNGIITTDTRPFNPHLTLFKLSKARELYRKGVKKIDSSWTLKYSGHHFGIENFRSLHLCNMLKKQSDGYYEIFNEQDLFPDKVDSIPSISMSLVDTIAIENLHATTIESEQRIAAETLVSNESAPLLQHDRSTYEGPFTGLASFVPSSRFRTCLCCSII